MRAILSIIVLSLLAGCASHYYPLYDGGQGIYYQDKAGAYNGRSPTSFADAGPYPGWSIDLFYMGSTYYWSGAGVYYSPNFYPYYFSVLYPPWHWQSRHWYGGYYAWHDPQWQHGYRRHWRPPHGGNHGGHVGNSDRVPTNGPYVLSPGSNQDLRRITLTSPGNTGGSMTVVSPANSKEKNVRIGPTRPGRVSVTIDSTPVVSSSLLRSISSHSGSTALITSPGKSAFSESRLPSSRPNPVRHQD